MCVRDYQSLYAAVTICSTLVNIQTHTQTTFRSAYMKSSASRAKNWLSAPHPLLWLVTTNARTESPYYIADIVCFSADTDLCWKQQMRFTWSTDTDLCWKQQMRFTWAFWYTYLLIYLLVLCPRRIRRRRSWYSYGDEYNYNAGTIHAVPSVQPPVCDGRLPGRVEQRWRATFSLW